LEAGYDGKTAERFIDLSIWDQIDTVVPKYGAVAEEIIIEQEELLKSEAKPEG
jgi:hypothetical protein